MSETGYKNTIGRAGRKPVGAMPAIIMAVGLSLSLSLGACAAGSAPKSTGEQLSDRGSEIRDYGTVWSQGQARVVQAEKAIRKSDRSRAKGERDLERARKELAKAERQISDASVIKAAALKRIEDGRAQMSQAEADYADTKAGPSAINPAGGGV